MSNQTATNIFNEIKFLECICSEKSCGGYDPYWTPQILKSSFNGPVGYANPSVGVAGDGASPGFRYNILCATDTAPCVARDITTRVQDTKWDIRKPTPSNIRQTQS